MDDHDKKRRRAQRHEAKRLRHGTLDPACVVCGNMNIPSLLAVPCSQLPMPVRHKLIEEHHLAGRQTSDHTVPVCRNCHAILSDDQYDWPARARRPRTQDERLAAFLQGLADWVRALGHALIALAESLQAWVSQLLGGRTGEGAR